MALTRPTIQNINTNLVAFSDSLTITNFGNVANRDIGEVFDRSQGGGSNVAIIWNESNQAFRLGYTSGTGKETGNLTITSNADLIVGNLTAGNLIVANVIYENTEYVSSTEVVAGNSTVNALTVNNSATIGTTLGVTGNLTTTNILPSANSAYNLGSPTLRYKSLYLSGNTIYMDGTTISSNATSITITNPSGGSFTVTGSTAIVANSSAGTAQYVTANAQGNITSVGTLTGLTLSGTMIGTTLNAATFGNAGATFTGSTFSAAGSFYGPYSGVIGGAGANTALVTTLTSTGNTTVSALTVNGSATVGTTLGVAGNLIAGNITLAAITNLSIPGGSSGYVIKTDGAGTLSWAPDLNGGITYTANTAPPTTGNLKGDQWYNTSTDVLYEYSYDGTSYYWIDQSGAAFGNANGTSILVNGLSNVNIGTYSGNITASVNGSANLVVISSTSTGATMQVTGANTRGGTGYADVIQVTNNSGGATNTSKWIRLNSTGGLEMINSAYSAQVFSVSDSGVVSAGNQIAINGLQAVNGPTFQAFLLNPISVNSGSTANVVYQGALYDTHSCYNTSTGVFKPNVAGYYQFNWTAGANSYPASSGICTSSLRKNGQEYARGARGICNTGGYVVNGSAQCYLNGTTDYVYITFLQSSGGAVNLEADAGSVVNGGSYANYFSGSMVRGA